VQSHELITVKILEFYLAHIDLLVTNGLRAAIKCAKAVDHLRCSSTNRPFPALATKWRLPTGKTGSNKQTYMDERGN
jgi:hypothetical protein